MNELAIEKLELLMKDIKEDEKRQKESKKYFFNHSLFGVRVKEIYKLLKNEE